MMTPLLACGPAGPEFAAFLFIFYFPAILVGGMCLSLPVLIAVKLVKHYHATPKLRMANRKAKGLCLKCGYDLRGTPHRCPECGTTATLDAAFYRLPPRPAFNKPR